MTLNDKIKNGEFEDIKPNGIEEVDEVEALCQEVKQKTKMNR